MDKARGLPIAAYLGTLVALALASAFVAVLAVVIWLPPRPPDVMRADAVAELFADGYQHMREEGRPLPNSSMIWRVSAEQPRTRQADQVDGTELLLADRLDLTPDQVRVAAQHVRRSDVFVFQVRDIDEVRRGTEEAAREAMQEAELEARVAEAEVAAAEAELRDAERVARESADEPLEAREVAREIERDARRELEHARAAEREARQQQGAAAAAIRRIHIRGDHVVVRSRTRVTPDGGEHVSTFELRVDTPSSPPVPPVPASTAGQAAPTPPAPPVAPTPPMFAPAPAGVALISGFQVSAELPDGRWLTMRQGQNWAELGWIVRAALIIGGTLLLLSLLAILFARRLTQPIRNFSQAVQAVGVDPQSEPVREEGPRELRGAARAVNTMQARLRALIADRTKTLAAVAHDMRTPLMRLRLAAENAPADQRDRMAKEIAEVEALVASFIAFARDDPAEEARVRVDLAALLQSIADDHTEAGRFVSYAGEERMIVTGQSLGLKRLFNNLVENALKYGGTARIVLKREAGAVVVDVEDDGPGVPPGQRESVFEPFVRLEDGAGRAASGAGLGLPAARSIARAHGGDVVILDASSGALVRVTLPG